jgi:hypothetical protein
LPGSGCLESCACFAGSACGGASWAVAVKVFCEVTPDENFPEKRSLRAGSLSQAGPAFLNGEEMGGDWVASFAASCSMDESRLLRV